MPELPEVETIARQVRPHIVGRRIVAFDSSWPKNVTPSLVEVRQLIHGQRVRAVDRRAKYIVLRLDDGYVLVHLRMSGRLACIENGTPEPPYVRARWDLDDGSRMLFCDARKFGRILCTTDLAAATAGLGPEPLANGFTARALGAILRGRQRQLKPLLLDQSVIAGLGNIYTDEALFRARLHPLTPSQTLRDDEIARLHRAIRGVLRLAIRHHGTSLDWIYPGGWMQRHLNVYGRAGLPCRVCHTPIVALRVGQRGTHICPTCQPPSRRRRPARP